MLKKFYKLFAQKGQGIVEYALLLGFVAIITCVLYSGADGGLMGAFKKALLGVMGQFTQFN